ncbi:MAG: GNAT family N-acetyltransferase [Chloroflexota bacterium]
MRFKIREAKDDDGERLIDLIAACYGEYDGCVLRVEDEAPELNTIATSHQQKGGRFWVAEQNGDLVGAAGLVPSDRPGVIEMKKLYVAQNARKIGLAARLCSLVEVEAMSRGAEAIELWSDTRFKDAHRLYERRGYTRGPKTRSLNDASKSVEYYYRKEL